MTELSKRLQTELPMLPDDSRTWFEQHRTTLREITVSADPDSSRTMRVWLVTDHTGNNDGSSRVVYDPTTKMFGLVMELRTGVLWYMGPHGSFVDAVESI